VQKPVTVPGAQVLSSAARAAHAAENPSPAINMSNHTEGHSPRRGWEHLPPRERRVAEAVLHRRNVARDVHQDYLERRTFGERMADRIAAFGGSWPFIGLFALFLAVWIALNTLLGARREAFDPYPFILLNLLLSTLAALQAPVIMMSQNRQAARDRLNAANDYEVNLKAEVEIRALHDKLDTLRETDWAELVRLQQLQIQMLQRLLAGAGGEGAAS
jgi:uncharacterized membrane protein